MEIDLGIVIWLLVRWIHTTEDSLCFVRRLITVYGAGNFTRYGTTQHGLPWCSFFTVFSCIPLTSTSLLHAWRIRLVFEWLFLLLTLAGFGARSFAFDSSRLAGALLRISFLCWMVLVCGGCIPGLRIWFSLLLGWIVIFLCLIHHNIADRRRVGPWVCGWGTEYRGWRGSDAKEGEHDGCRWRWRYSWYGVSSDAWLMKGGSVKIYLWV